MCGKAEIVVAPETVGEGTYLRRMLRKVRNLELSSALSET